MDKREKKERKRGERRKEEKKWREEYRREGKDGFWRRSAGIRETLS